MGLTRRAVGAGAPEQTLTLQGRKEGDHVIALAGNPNVGKSTVFNALTGMHQHTGNWPGKTVSLAQGYYRDGGESFLLVDIPGTYSLLAHSPEEEVARNFLCFGEPDAVAVVCDATCLERNLNLVLQVLEITPRAVVCVNLLDEAKRRGVNVDLAALSRCLGVPVLGTVARKKRSLAALPDALVSVIARERNAYRVEYDAPVEAAIASVCEALQRYDTRRLPLRWLALRLLDADGDLQADLRSPPRVTHWSVRATAGQSCAIRPCSRSTVRPSRFAARRCKKRATARGWSEPIAGSRADFALIRLCYFCSHSCFG